MRSHYYEAYRQIDRAITLDLGQLSHIESLSFHMQEGLGWGFLRRRWSPTSCRRTA